MGSCHGCRAYSLIEIMTVLAVLGLLFGLAMMATVVLTATSLTASTRNFADFLNLCRSQAIANHTAVRVGIVIDSSGNPNAEFRQYAAWKWNQRSREFEQMTRWNVLPEDVIFDRVFPPHLLQSFHAERDASSVRGDFVLAGEKNQFDAEDANGRFIRLAFLQFKPSGRVEAPGAELRNLILVLRPNQPDTKQPAGNWSQINLDTLTGRYRVYRPE